MSHLGGDVPRRSQPFLRRLSGSDHRYRSLISSFHRASNEEERRMVVNHSQVGRVLIVEHRDQPHIRLFEHPAPVLDTLSIDLLNLDCYVCQAFEVIEIEACIESFQGSSQSKRTWTVE
jgi:hypothetical protein